MFGTILIVLGLTATAYGVTLFTQRFPSIPTTSIVLVANCSDPTELTPSATELSVGSSGYIRFTCGSQGAAFRVDISGSATPTFSLPTEYTRLRIIGRTGFESCDNPGQTLTSGTAVSFDQGSSIGNQFDYCADFVSAPSTGLPAFSITWTSV